MPAEISTGGMLKDGDPVSRLVAQVPGAQAVDENGRTIPGGLKPDGSAGSQKITAEGHAIAGHGEFEQDIINVDHDDASKVTGEIAIGGRNALVLTWENQSSVTIDYTLSGRHTSGGTNFLLNFSTDGSPTTLTLLAGETHHETLTDAWSFLFATADPQSDPGALGDNRSIVKAQERT